MKELFLTKPAKSWLVLCKMECTISDLSFFEFSKQISVSFTVIISCSLCAPSHQHFGRLYTKLSLQYDAFGPITTKTIRESLKSSPKKDKFKSQAFVGSGIKESSLL